MVFSLWDASSTYTQSHLAKDFRVVLMELTFWGKNFCSSSFFLITGTSRQTFMKLIFKVVT
jgi:hypothetical protein